jgi:hypothetical protein
MVDPACETGVRRAHRNVDSADVDWHQADLSKLFEQIRERFPASEAEKMVWAFERAFEVARVDEQLLEHLLVAAACLVAQTQDVTPRGVFEQFFRRRGLVRSANVSRSAQCGV